MTITENVLNTYANNLPSNFNNDWDPNVIIPLKGMSEPALFNTIRRFKKKN